MTLSELHKMLETLIELGCEEFEVFVNEEYQINHVEADIKNKKIDIY